MVSWEDVAVPKPYPQEFRDDVVRVARDREPGVTVEQIAKDFGIHPMTLFKWLRQAEVGIAELKEAVDTLIVIPNQRLLATAARNTSMLDAFRRRFRLLSGPAEQRISHPPRFEVRVNRRLVGESRRQG